MSFYFVDISKEDKVVLYIVVFGVSFAMYLILYFRNKKSEFWKDDVRWVLFAAIVLRLVLILQTPMTSDDYYRYLWDGKVQSEGTDPYMYSPLELTELHDEVIYPNVSFPDIKTIYPPVSQIIFYFGYLFSPHSAAGLKIIYLIFDIGIMLFILGCLKKMDLSSSSIILYAFSPLIILEFFLNAHIDIVLIFFLSGCIYFTLNKNLPLSLLFLGISVLSKTYSLMFLPVLLLYFYKQEISLIKILKNIIFFLLPFSIIYFYREGIINIFQVMGNYMTHWYSNNLIYKIILFLSELTGINDHAVTRKMLLIFFVISYFTILFSKTDFIKKITFILIFYFLFSHTVHPWYLSVLVMMLPLYFSYTSIYWTGIIALTNLTVYYYLSTGIWEDVFPVLMIEYVGVLVLLFLDFKKLKNADQDNLLTTKEIT
ncbi:MAG: hypothetical protein WAT71_10905 [Ignavibacteria bacterium]